MAQLLVVDTIILCRALPAAAAELVRFPNPLATGTFMAVGEPDYIRVWMYYNLQPNIIPIPYMTTGKFNERTLHHIDQ